MGSDFITDYTLIKGLYFKRSRFKIPGDKYDNNILKNYQNLLKTT